MNEVRCSVCYTLNPYNAHACQRCKKVLFVPPETGDTKPLGPLGGTSQTVNSRSYGQRMCVTLAMAIGALIAVVSVSRLPTLGLSPTMQTILIIAIVHTAIHGVQQHYAKAVRAVVIWGIVMYGLTSGIYLVSVVACIGILWTTRRIE